MDLLREISDKIDFIKTSPDQVDLDDICNVLASAYEVAEDGLKRSHSSMKCEQFKSELAEVSAKFASASEELEALKSKSEKLEREKETFSLLLRNLKNKLQGKILLTKKYSPELKELYKRNVEKSDIEAFLDLQTVIEEDFSQEWQVDDKTEKLSVTSGTFIENISHYKSGA